jgi:flagellar biosynthesis regulator FlaF
MTSPVLSVTALQIIKKALRLINELDASQEPEATDTIDSLEALNFMIKAWQSQGLHLWTKTEGILFLDVGGESYNIGPSGDEAGNLDDTVFPTITTAATVTENILTLSSTTGINAATNILPFDPATTTQSWTVNAGSIDDSTGSLILTNGTGVSADIERTLEDLTVGTTYQITIDFTKGTDVGLRYQIKDGTTVLVSNTLTSTQTDFLEFTALQTSHTLALQNLSTTTGTTSQVNSFELNDETTGSFIGIQLDDGTRQWSKVVNVNSSTEVFISDLLTDGAAVGNVVASFPELLPRPINILDLRRSTTTSTDSEIEAIKWSRQQYFAQPDKESQGTINNWYYSPQLTDGRLYVWQTANNVNQVAKFTYIRPLEINETTSDAPDFPSEWFLTLAYNLAAEIGPEYRLPDIRLNMITLKADRLLQDSLGFDQEESSLNIMPDFRGIGGGFA